MKGAPYSFEEIAPQLGPSTGPLELAEMTQAERENVPRKAKRRAAILPTANYARQRLANVMSAVEDCVELMLKEIYQFGVNLNCNL